MTHLRRAAEGLTYGPGLSNVLEICTERRNWDSKRKKMKGGKYNYQNSTKFVKSYVNLEFIGIPQNLPLSLIFSQANPIHNLKSCNSYGRFQHYLLSVLRCPEFSLPFWP
jgi:hypothetical protein